MPDSKLVFLGYEWTMNYDKAYDDNRWNFSTRSRDYRLVYYSSIFENALPKIY